ncbi:hypothetical protein GCM10022225_61010 [Plantactinospora mayteni]|uniref:Uncharacterized protein n=1 Tax=Plantactinospora mayteni TaxID=566021 RepID=A0ABQ4EZR7_9ACTN|nr:hypothetical protein Pma05_67290 [Plantactinospora mayteni]
MTAGLMVDPSAVCMPCWLAARAPVTTDPHGCPGFVVIAYGGVPSVKPCTCLVCWPDGPPSAPESPFRLAFPDG